MRLIQKDWNRQWNRYLIEVSEDETKQKYFGEPVRQRCLDYDSSPMIELCLERDGFKKFGGGVHRIVFTVPGNDEIVIKIARPGDKSAISVNKSEADTQMQTKYQDLVPKVYDVAPDYRWIKVERVHVLGHDKEEEILSFFPYINKQISSVWDISPYTQIALYLLKSGGDEEEVKRLARVYGIPGVADEDLQYDEYLDRIIDTVKKEKLLQRLAMYFSEAGGDPYDAIMVENSGYVIRDGKKQFVIVDLGQTYPDYWQELGLGVPGNLGENVESNKEKYFGTDPEKIPGMDDYRKRKMDMWDFIDVLHENGYSRLGSGASRTVFSHPNMKNMVLKIAGGDDGNEATEENKQDNATEANNAYQTKYQGLVPKVYDAADDYLWIKVEKVDHVIYRWRTLYSKFPNLSHLRHEARYGAGPHKLFAYCLGVGILHNKTKSKQRVKHLIKMMMEDYFEDSQEYENEEQIYKIIMSGNSTYHRLVDLLSEHKGAEWDVRPDNVGFIGDRLVLLDAGVGLEKWEESEWEDDGIRDTAVLRRERERWEASHRKKEEN